jgi:hypothetical protein
MLDIKIKGYDNQYLSFLGSKGTINVEFSPQIFNPNYDNPKEDDTTDLVEISVRETFAPAKLIEVAKAILKEYEPEALK